MAGQTVAEQYADLVDAVRRYDSLEWVQVRHEEVAAFAAGAEAQLTGRLAACAGSCGPGNPHLINGLFDAHRSMAPVLARRTDPERRDRHRILPGEPFRGRRRAGRPGRRRGTRHAAGPPDDPARGR
ncbi:hypothetical protein SUDANB180_07297 [Streptomyces sp. enrichment culture]